MQSESSPFAPVLPDPAHSPDARQLTEREAFLFMIYVHKLAPLVRKPNNTLYHSNKPSLTRATMLAISPSKSPVSLFKTQ
jgi:hypothetical protein